MELIKVVKAIGSFWLALFIVAMPFMCALSWHKVPVLYEAVNKGIPLTANVLKEDIYERETES